MTVYLPKGATTYYYDFWWRGQRYRDSTHQQRLDDARLFENKLKLQLRQDLGGVAATDPTRSPRISDWAEIYYAHAAKELTRPDRVEDLLRVVLRFWGARPSGENPDNPLVEGEPYHDLHLLDPVLEPDWITQFEAWMEARGRAGQTKNQYRSTMSQMYKLALQPIHRKRTKITMNPFAGIFRDRGGARDVALDPADVRALLTHASYHVRLAVAIGALAPKLRLANILGLQWQTHFDRGLHFITIAHHKTRKDTGKPLVLPVSEQLRTILLDARQRNTGRYVVTYRGEPVTQIRGGLKGAAKRAGLTYGRLVENGLTFHTLRHTAATIMADLDVAEGKRKAVMGHKRIETTQRYTHMRPVHEKGATEQLSAALPIQDLVTVSWRRAKGTLGKSLGTRSGTSDEPPINPHKPDTDAERPDLRMVPRKRG